MTDFTNCNKVSGIYRSTDKIENFKFKIKFKEINTIIPLPNFETFASQENQTEKENVGYLEDRLFSWQEKVLSSAEIYTYKDIVNCHTDAQKRYHSNISENELKSGNHNKKIFSYTDDDSYEGNERLTTDFRDPLDGLSKKFKILQIDKNELEESGDILVNSRYKREDASDKKETKAKVQKMFIMIDMDNAESDPTYLLRREHILFTLTWNPMEKCLTVYPDFNDLYLNPYLLEVSYYSKQTFHYSIEHVIEDFLDEAKIAELQLLNKIEDAQRQIYSNKLFKHFILPPKNIMKCLYIIEILSAHKFEYDNLYVEYTVELPFGFVTSDALKGVTQIACSKRNENSAYFGHIFELCINYQIGITVDAKDSLPREPEMYLEVISCDMWDRHRTEGYCYMKLPVTQPGHYSSTLRTVRPQGKSIRLWEMNRYFVGGRHVLNDLSWLSIPPTLMEKKLSKIGVKTVSSGHLKVTMNVILQSQNFKIEENKSKDSSFEERETLAERLTADSLFKSVNTVLQAYKHAKKKLASCQETDDT